MGSRHLPDHTALGDSVNKAFRLESATRDLNADIVLGSLTYDLLCTVTPDRKGLERQVFQLKGYPEPEEAYVTDFTTIARILQSLQQKARGMSDIATS
jgi:adenylate cyclase